MKVDRYKMKYLTKMNEELENMLKRFTKEIREEITSNDIRILGHYFVKNNKNKANLIINNKKYKIKEFINYNEFKDDKLKINMLLYKDLSNASHMFQDCAKLIEYSIINIDDEEPLEYYNYFIDEREISNDSYKAFYKNSKKYDINSICSGLTNGIDDNYDNSIRTYIKDNITIYQFNYYYNMSWMFSNCSSLLSLPDISKWNTNNVFDMHKMFYNCSSLSSLPDISKWSTNNVIDMSGMFYNCSSLPSIPDISKWKTNNVNNMGEIFSHCSSLASLPEISKWNTNNVINMNYMFFECSSLSLLPDISKWNTNKVAYMSGIFYDCVSLSSLPDISKWNTNNLRDMSGIFYNCSLLSSLPNISEWNTNNANINIKIMHLV